MVKNKELTKRVLAFMISSALVIAICLFSTSCTKSPESSETENNSETVSTEIQNVFDENEPKSENSSLLNEENSETAAPGAETEITANQSEALTDRTEQISLETTEEIVAFFNQSANKVKTDAVKVVKNYEKRKTGELKVPDALQSTAESLMGTLMKDDTEPVVYAEKEEIRENFIVPNQSYVSRLTAADVEKATCKDNGREIEIYFKLKDEKNPVSGKGVGSVCDVIEAHDVAEKAPSFVKELSTYYSNCEVRATIDKATGKMTHATYSTPVRLNVTVDLFGTHDVVANFTFVKDYSITY